MSICNYNINYKTNLKIKIDKIQMATNYVSLFNEQFKEFIDFIQKTFPEDSDILSAKNSLMFIRKTNPKMIMSIWKSMVTDKYGTQIEEGNIQFFLEKNYAEDAPGSLYTPTVDNTIQEIREAIKTMSEENKAISLKYIQNLCKLSKLYVY